MNDAGRFATATWTLTFAVSLGLAALAAGEAEAPGGATPQAVYDRLQAAMAGQDMAELARCVSPAGAAQLVMKLYVATTMGIAFSNAEDEAAAKAGQEKLDGIMAAHGATVAPEEVGAALQGGPPPASLLAVADPGALVAELEALAIEAGMKKSAAKEAQALGDLEGLEIEGTTARATTSAGPIQFVQEDGRWFLGEEVLGQLESNAAAE